jgi:putative membrane protein
MIIRIPKRTTFYTLMTLVVIYTLGVTYLDSQVFPHQQVKEAGAATIGGLIMSLLLAFRTNTAYERWWEGRKLWGQLVNEIRNMGLKARNYTSVTQGERREFADLLIAFPYALKEHLRNERPSEKVRGLVSSVADVEHVPLHIADLVFHQAQVRTRESDSPGIDLLIADPHLRALMDICGACERIKGSPIVRTYKDLIWLLLGLYLLLLPWMLVPIIDEWAIPITIIAAFFAITLELVAEEVEQPFGYESNDLPLDELCATMERSIRQLAD